MPLENVCEKKADLEFLGYTKLRRLRNQSGLSKKTRRKRQEMVNSSICQPTDLQSKQSVVTHCFDRHRFDNCDVPFIPQQTDVGSSSLPLATVFWDFENINVGRKDIVHFICSFKLFLQTNGYLLESFNAIGNLSQAPALRLILEHLALVDVKNQNKQAADDHIISHMEFFTRAITPKEQHTIFLVSGDSDFIPIVKEMKLRGYKVNIVYRSTIAASSKLLNRADQLFKFSEIMRFGGLRF
ncbi:hypothetical protein BC833DRAFT_231570 [Globomyces pollinis-pini]|nr:hypothetical protein BC833DRAFT_231570 [Globomyces pollinis-pini]